MYNNHVNSRGYYSTQPGDYPQQPSPSYPVLPSARIPGYTNAAPRPVYRNTAPPAGVFDSSTYQRLAARTTPRPARPADPNPFLPLAGVAPYAAHGQNLAPLLSTPFHVRPRSPNPAQEQYSQDELDLLRRAGFHRRDRDRLSLTTDRQFRFVMRHAMRLAERHFSPNDVISTAMLAHEQRNFVARNARALAHLDFTPRDMIDLARMAQRARSFVRDEGARLHALGFMPLQSMMLANRSFEERRHVLDHGAQLQASGYRAIDISRQARTHSVRPAARAPYDSAPRPPMQMPAQAQAPYYNPARPPMPAPYYSHPAPPPPLPWPAGGAYPQAYAPGPAPAPARRASTSEMLQRRAHAAAASDQQQARTRSGGQERTANRDVATPGAALMPAERQGFAAMGLDPETVQRLASGSDLVRTYVLAHGSALMESGLSIDEIIIMAQHSAESDPAGPADGRRTAPAPTDVAVHDMGSLFASLGIADAVDAAPRRTLSPEPMASRGISHPRNDAILSPAEVAVLDHANRRWGGHQVSRADGEAFYRDTVPYALTRQLDPHPNLALLLAGVAYAEDNRHTDTAPHHRARVKALTDYLTNAGDPDLHHNADSAAAEGVTHCGDRVAYGLTRVEQVVMQHQIEHGEMPPRKMFDSIESVFVQRHTENIATYLANARKARGARQANTSNYTRESFAAQVQEAADANFGRATGGSFRARVMNLLGSHFGEATPTDNSASESLEMYAALTPVLARHGVNLVETARTSTYGGMYQIEPLELDYALTDINRHVRGHSDEFLQEFEGNSAVERVLRQCFQGDFRSMLEQREEMQDQADDALFDTDAPEGTQETVRGIMDALATMDKDWYRDKLKQVLARPDMLENLPPLAPDLAGD